MDGYIECDICGERFPIGEITMMSYITYKKNGMLNTAHAFCLSHTAKEVDEFTTKINNKEYPGGKPYDLL